MSKHIFKGAGVALITPMHSDGSVNYEELARLLEFQVENGTDAILVLGTTGESSTMTDREDFEVAQFVTETLLQEAAQFSTVFNPDTVGVVDLHKNLVVAANLHVNQEITLILEPFLHNAFYYVSVYHINSLK